MSWSSTGIARSFGLARAHQFTFPCHGILTPKAWFPSSTSTRMLACAMPAVPFSRSAVSKMDPNLLFIVIGILLLIGAWKKWLAEEILLPRLRKALFLLGLCVVSLALIEYAQFIVHVHRIGGFGNNFAEMLRWARPGFFLSLASLILAAVGRGRSRLCAVAA